jgi:hypothetical protein
MAASRRPRPSEVAIRPVILVGCLSGVPRGVIVGQSHEDPGFADYPITKTRAGAGKKYSRLAGFRVSGDCGAGEQR